MFAVVVAFTVVELEVVKVTLAMARLLGLIVMFVPPVELDVSVLRVPKPDLLFSKQPVTAIAARR